MKYRVPVTVRHPNGRQITAGALIDDADLDWFADGWGPDAIAQALAVLTPHTLNDWRPTAQRLWAYGYSVEQAVWLGRRAPDPSVVDAWLDCLTG